MAHDVFISYANEDKPTADALVATLENQHIRCWIAPRDVLPGQDYADALIGAIGDAQVMVLVFSSNANDSPHVMTEVERAASKGIAILPVRIEDVVPSKSMEYFISRTHWLDALTPPLEKHLQQLADTVRQLLLARAGRAAPVEEEPEADVSARTAEGAGGADGGRPPSRRGVLEVARRWGRRPMARLAVGAGAIAVVTIIILVVLLSGGGNGDGGQTLVGTQTLTESVSPSLNLGDACQGEGGFDDINTGTQVVVADGAGDTLATGELGPGAVVESPGGAGFCEFGFEVAEVPKADSYTIEVSDRGALPYTLEELEENGWTVSFTLGDGGEDSGNRTLVGTFTIMEGVSPSLSLGDDCEGEGGYDDIYWGTQVVVEDGAGVTLAIGELGPGAVVESPGGAGYCEFGFEVAEVPNADFYSIEVSQRGALTYTREELEEKGWTVSFTLGS